MFGEMNTSKVVICNMLIANIETIEFGDSTFTAWYPQIREPFFKDGSYWIGLSRNWIYQAQMAGISKIKYEWKGVINTWFVPDKKMLKKMEKDGDIIKKVHLFPDNPLITYLFKLDNTNFFVRVTNPSPEDVFGK